MNNNIRELLCWIIGTQPSFKTDAFFDEEAALNAILGHKLLFLLLFRSNIQFGGIKNSVDVFPKTFVEKCLCQVYRRCMQFGQQIKLISELNTKMPNCGFPIKGVVPYLLTHDEKFIRNSSDIDYVGDDHEIMLNIILGMGGEIINKSLSGHEREVFKLNNVCIEGHIGFPVIHIPDDAIMYQGTVKPIITDYLSYDYMKAHLVWCDEINGYIPNVELTALILCLHAYKDFYWEPYNIPKVRLGDIYILHEIVTAMKFDLADFMNMVYESRAIPAVEFAMNLINSIWNDVNLPACTTLNSQVLLKTANAMYGSYVNIGKRWADIPFMDISDTVRVLGWGDAFLPCTISSKADRTYKIEHAGTCIDVEAVLSDDCDVIVANVSVTCNNQLRSVMLAMEDDVGHIYFSGREVSKRYGFFYKLALENITDRLNGVEMRYTLRTHNERCIPIVIVAECFCVDGNVAQVAIGKCVCKV